MSFEQKFYYINYLQEHFLGIKYSQSQKSRYLLFELYELENYSEMAIVIYITELAHVFYTIRNKIIFTI